MSDIAERYKSGERSFQREVLFRESLPGIVLTSSDLTEANYIVQLCNSGA